MENQELNEKLAKWAGFEPDAYGWLYPDKSWWRFLPYFDTDLNACFKWLVPNVEEKYSRGMVSRMLEEWIYQVVFESIEPALAFSKAIESLINASK